jgi:peptide/nickel transport system permease protein
MKVVQGDLGRSLASGRPVWSDLSSAIGNTLMLAAAASILGFILGCVLGGLAGTFRGSWLDRVAVTIAVGGVSVPHYWLGMVMVVIFSVQLNWLPAMGAGPGGSSDWVWDWEHMKHLILPTVTLSVIPMGIVTRTVRGIVAEIMNQEFVTALRGKGLTRGGVFLHVVKNAAPTALAVMGLQLGYLMGGSILVETVFSWPGTGLLLNNAIFQRDLPVLQGTILVLAMFFVALNLLVDLMQTALDPRIKRN